MSESGRLSARFFRLVCLFSLFAGSLFSNSPNSPKFLLEEGVRLAENEQFQEALKLLNQAMGILRQVPANDPLRIEVEKQIRITKGRFLVTRYRGGKLAELPKTMQLMPLSKEPGDFFVSQAFGSVLAREIWERRDQLRTNQTIGVGRRVTVLPNGGVELNSNNASGLSLRAVQAASFDLKGLNEVDLHSGSYVLHVMGEDSKVFVRSPLSEMRIRSDDSFAIMVGITTNGGMKVICLLGKISIKTKNFSETLLPGELTFALPEGFSRKMNVELSTLMVTANLLTAFEDPPPYMKKLRQQAMLQAMRTNKRFRTVVGDVKGNENFELKVLREEER